MTLLNTTQKRFNHNRKRNTGLVYEFLVRQMAAQMIDKDQTGWKKSFVILKKYFSPGSPLAEELELFKVIQSSRGLSQFTARRVLAQLLGRSKKFDEKTLDIKKSNLIKELNYTFGKDFFSRYRIPNYRLLASIQMLIDNYRRPGKLTEEVQQLQLEESLVVFMMNTPTEEKPKIEEKVDSFVFSVAEKKFSDRYGKVLSESQKSLLDRFAKSLLTKQSRLLKEQIVNEKARILTVLRGSRGIQEIRSDKEMQKKLEEAISQLMILDESSDVQLAVEQLLLYERLVEELKSNE